jgi:hypothetical protein
METNVLYYGDNLDILRPYLPDAAVNLVYLDPPFNSKCDDNVIFRDESGNATDAQLLAFEDSWHWGPSAEATYAYLTNARHESRVPDKVSTIMRPCAQALTQQNGGGEKMIHAPRHQPLALHAQNGLKIINTRMVSSDPVPVTSRITARRNVTSARASASQAAGPSSVSRSRTTV